ncbi:MFS transporter [Candidatus Bathyarchaeota archaeon]|nr:MFS transporter [Candidatus Bathyarchaeota archaeon]
MAGTAGSKKTSILTYGLFVMTLTHTLTHVFGRLYTATFPLIREEFLLTSWELGMIAAIPPLCQAVISIPVGLLCDRIGSKRMLLISMLFAAAGSLLAATAANPIMLVAAISLVYLNTTFYHPASYSFTTRLFTGERRPRALGIHGAGGTFGMALGPLTLTIFLGYLGLTWRNVYLFWAIPIILGTFLVMRVDFGAVEEVEVTRTEERGGSGGAKSLITPALLTFLVYTAMRTMAMQMIGPFMPIFMVDEKGFTVNQMGLIYSSLSISGLISAPLGGVFASRFGSKRWLATTISISTVLLGLVAVAPGGWPFVVAYMVYGFSGTLGMAARSDIIARLTPRNQRGLGYSLLFLPGSIMGAISPLVSAKLIEVLGFSQLFPIAIGISVVSILILIFAIKERPKTPSP